MTWREHHPAMVLRTGGLRAAGSPADFPTEAELEAAKALDELSREINQEHDAEVEAIAEAVACRLDRMQRGFSLVEILAGMLIIAMIALVAVSTFGNMGHEARLARCCANIYTMATAVDYLRTSTPGMQPPSIQMYNFYHPKISPTFDGIYYIPDGDPNAGHGNDIDFCDEDNPGQGMKRDCVDIDYVIVCDHDHGDLAAFVYLENDGVPTLAMNPGQVDAPYIKDFPYDDSPPDYSRFIKLAYKGAGR
jgi:prepilin-type N-terminal cleavage/methylation domain-containing protein